MINNPFDYFYSSEINSEEYPSLELTRNLDSFHDFFHEDFEYNPISYITKETSKNLEMNLYQNKETVLKEEKDENNKAGSKEKKIKFKISTNSNKNINVNEDNKEFRYDDEVQKIKGYFLKSLWRFLNNKHHKIININLNRIYSEFLKKIKYKYYSSTKKEDNLLFLEFKIKDLFNQEISGYYSEEDKNINKQNIDNFFKNYKNIKEINELYDILENKYVEQMLNSYVKGDYKEEGFYLENDLALIKEKSKNKKGVILEKYIETLREIVKNFRKIFEEKSGRNKPSKNHK